MTVQQLLQLMPKAAGDYVPDKDVFCEDSARFARLKWILANRLTRGDRTILLLYAEADNYRLVARALAVSESYARKRVGEIRARVIDELKKLENHVIS